MGKNINNMVMVDHIATHIINICYLDPYVLALPLIVSEWVKYIVNMKQHEVVDSVESIESSAEIV